MDNGSGIKLGIVRGISFGVFGAPDDFMPQVRALGAGLARIYLTWNQVEPQPGRYDWAIVDALLAQLQSGDEIWVTVVSSSRWATQQATDFLPASPANDLSAYLRFVEALVGHCRGTVAYWQCNNEPSNAGLWAGSAADYAAQAIAFADAVRRTDRGAKIVLGGCGYDVLSAPADATSRKFFGEVLSRAGNAFDLFAVHLYDDPRRIPEHIGDVRAMMRAHGYERPVVVGEYGGPTLLQFPQLDGVMQQVMMEAFSNAAPSLDSADLRTAVETPDRQAMRLLYERIADLPPELQMFMRGCPPALEAKRHRIACREMVTRNLLAMAEGVTRTLCWDLAPEVPNYRDPFNLMGFLSDKLALMDFDGTVLKKREPAAETFRRLASALEGAVKARRLEVRSGVVSVAVDRAGRGPLNVLWSEADPFIEDAPPVLVELPWEAPEALAVDVFGSERKLSSREGQLSLGVTTTPVLVSAVS